MLKGKQLPIRVVIVDDSAAVRELLIAILQNTGDIQIVGTGSNGEDAVRLVKRLRPDIITIDVNMPKMDGIVATRQIMRECPTPIVIVSASSKQSDMDHAFQALQAGALTVINKPGLEDPTTCAKVIETVRVMAGVPVIHHWGKLKSQQPAAKAEKSKSVETTVKKENKHRADLHTQEIDIIGIAASTGGPSALATVLRKLTPEFPLPILIVQHISTGFATGLSDWLSTQIQLRVEVAAHGDTLQPGVVLLAPDDYHIQVNERGIVELSKAEPYKGLRPSANVLFESLARVFGPRAMGIILTGMGDDGVNGIEDLHRAGGLTFAQDEESCVVFGMPQQAIYRKAVDQVFGLEEIALLLAEKVRSPQTFPAT